MSDVIPIRPAPPVTLRKDFEEAVEAMRQGRCVLGVAIAALSHKDDAGADVGEEWQALRVAYATLSNAEALFDDLRPDLPDEDGQHQ